MFSAVACVAFAFSGFTSNEESKDQIEFSKTCKYDIYKNGRKVGEVTVTDVPDYVACDSEIAKKNALDIYKKGIGLQP